MIGLLLLKKLECEYDFATKKKSSDQARLGEEMEIENEEGKSKVAQGPLRETLRRREKASNNFCGNSN